MANDTQNQTQDTAVGVGGASYNYLALFFGIPLILVIILGNVLVCLSVLTERALKTATNYFIVSLAVADLLLAVLVLPLYVYSEFQGGVWTLNTYLCDTLMTMDVMLCTASIFNLCAISVDRYIAVILPLKYNRNHFSVRQLVLIAATWVLSLGVASPVIFGLNDVASRDPRFCKLEDDNFVVYSSVCSFFVPCPVMLLLYYCIFRGLRKWSVGRKGQLAHTQRKFSFSLKSIKRDQSEKARYLMPSLSPSPATKGTPEDDLTPAQLDSVSDMEAPEKAKEGSPEENGVRCSLRSAKGSQSKSRRVSGRERKAMKVLPIVVGVFLACWTPFFVVHVMKVLCTLSCDIGSTLISVVTWLGYVNSAVNPIIYTAFNIEFRKVFQKLLGCQT
ncbi:D(4) dopamine receptor-like isoform X1 [Rhinatrema bivittatum]|uniref:D(4) dopamine receptor-like isoform X1 n=1 Tax=Rhinatrema bivittatum TaxID=194408 RepID=UPI001129B03C|nr:D(4) dopamine receptor-like isoform X1 [Rhinatrema bivittatum]XP_029471480.1 D(4) dopamine receptor-like isoform X1 [Rhinatrema bivittatum]